MSKSAHVERMETELAELHERLTKLEAFINSNPAYVDLAMDDKRLMRIQRAAMETYCYALQARYARSIPPEEAR